eukprot:sb/3478686/
MCRLVTVKQLMSQKDKDQRGANECTLVQTRIIIALCFIMLCFPANESGKRRSHQAIQCNVFSDLIVVCQRLITMLCETKLCMENISRSLSYHTNELSF